MIIGEFDCYIAELKMTSDRYKAYSKYCRITLVKRLAPGSWTMIYGPMGDDNSWYRTFSSRNITNAH